MRHFLRLGERTVPLEEELIVGRNGDCDLVLEVQGVSGRHARIVRVADGYHISDDGSTNGTKVGGVRLRPGVSRALTHGDQLLFGTVAASYHAALEVPQAPDASTAKVAFAMVQAMVASQDRGPIVRVVEGAEVGQQLSLPIDAGRTLGRAEEVDLRLLSDGISGRHLEIRRSVLGVFVRDLGSRFGSHLGTYGSSRSAGCRGSRADRSASPRPSCWVSTRRGPPMTLRPCPGWSQPLLLRAPRPRHPRRRFR